MSAYGYELTLRRDPANVRLWLFPEVNAIAGNVRCTTQSGPSLGPSLTSVPDPKRKLMPLAAHLNKCQS